MDFKMEYFLKWRMFYCGVWLLAHQGAIGKKITPLVINIGSTCGATTTPGLVAGRWKASYLV